MATFPAIFGHIFTANAQQWLFVSFWSKFWHHHSTYFLKEVYYMEWHTFSCYFGHFFDCACTEIAEFPLPLQNLIQSPFLSVSISHKRIKFLVTRVISGHIFIVHAQKQLLMTFQLKFWHHHLIPWAQFPNRVQYFCDLRTFSVDFSDNPPHLLI